jgi:hypothetical protein
MFLGTKMDDLHPRQIRHLRIGRKSGLWAAPASRGSWISGGPDSRGISPLGRSIEPNEQLGLGWCVRRMRYQSSMDSQIDAHQRDACSVQASEFRLGRGGKNVRPTQPIRARFPAANNADRMGFLLSVSRTFTVETTLPALSTRPLPEALISS